MTDYPMCCGRAAKDRGKESAYQDRAETTRIEPNRDAIAGASAFARQKGLEDPHAGIDYHKVMTHKKLITDLGAAYDKLPEHDPSAVKHFHAMRDEVNQQFHHLTHNLGVQVSVTSHDPYKDVHELAHDVRNNKHLAVLGTHATGAHPLFSNEENDKFRAVHDYFGHLATGRGFDRHGEEAAYQAHSRMFSHHARGAMASETRGQNGSLISNGHFGPQRIALLPHHLWTPGLARNAAADWHEFRRIQDAQQRRYERAGVGGDSEDRDRYFGTGEMRGRGEERLITPKDWLKYNKGPEEVRPPHEEENWRGFEMGQDHGRDLEHADFDEMERHHAQSPHPDHFYNGYLEGFKSMVNKTARVAVMVSDNPIKVVAHVSGNQVDILHCPFCGSGAVIGRSDGTVECGFCTSVYTVQVQPQFNGMPQSVDGQPYQWPGMPDPATNVMAEPDIPEGTNLNPNTNGEMDMGGAPGDFGSSDPAEGGDPDAEGEDGEEGDDDKPAFLKGKGDDSKADDKKKGDNPFAKKKSYRTAQGTELDEANYLAHLAIQFANDKAKVAAMVKHARRG